MKEITSSQGGRYRYNEDINALQESALAITEFFKQIKGNFIISGCKNNGSGYVWIDGKIRYVEAQSPSIKYDYIITEDINGADVEYHNKERHEMNVVYGAKYSTTPSSSDKTISVLQTLNNFPRIDYALFHQYSIDKNTTLFSEVEAPMNFSKILEGYSFNLKVGLSTIKIFIEYPYLLIIFHFGMNGREYVLRLPFEKRTVHFDGPYKEWSISSMNEHENDYGTLRFGLVKANDLDVRNICSCDDLQIKTTKGEYSSISSVLKYYNEKHYDLYGHAIDTTTGNSVEDVIVSQSDDIVTVYGILPIEYFIGDRSNLDYVGNPFFLNDLKKSNTYHLETSVRGNEGITFLNIKTSLRLPSANIYPSAQNLPGTILCSDIISPDGKGQLNGNIQLTIDKDGYFNLIVATTSVGTGNVHFVLNGNLADRNNGQFKIGPAFNLTYVL